MTKILKFLKKLMYWLTIVAPMVDAGKTIVNCIGAGIEQGRADVEAAKQNADIELFKSAYRTGTHVVEPPFGNNH